MRAREGKLAGDLGVTGAAVARGSRRAWRVGPAGQRAGRARCAGERAEAGAGHAHKVSARRWR